jgi:hypothetical protein
MNKFLIFITFLTFPVIISAQNQTIKPEVISSAGSRFQGNTMIIDWTLGEIAISTLQGNSVIISQGFHQPKLIVTRADDPEEINGEISVYPNPTSDKVSVRMNLRKFTAVSLRLFNSEGKIIADRKIHGMNILETISLGTLPNGNYILNLLPDGFKTAQTFKIQKIY